jgi:hypothetical protein
MNKKRKIWIFILLAIVNLIVILSFVYFTKRIRNSEDLRINSIEIPSERGDFLLYVVKYRQPIGIGGLFPARIIIFAKTFYPWP